MTMQNALRASSPSARSTRAAIIVAMAVAAVLTCAAIVLAAAGLIDDLVHGTVSTTLPVTGALSAGASVAAAYSTADVTVQEVPAGILALATGASIAGIVARASAGLVFVLICRHVLKSEPFSSRFSLVVTLLGGGIMLGALIEIGLGVFRDLMLGELLAERAPGAWSMTALFDPSLIALGLGVMIVGLLLDHAWRLQHATDGLV